MTEWRWPAPASNTYAFYVLLAIAIPIVDLGTSPPDRLRPRRPRADARGSADGDPRHPLVRVRVHGVRPRRDRPEPREPEAGRAEARLQPRDQRRPLGGAIPRPARPSSSARDAWFEDYWPTEPVERSAKASSSQTTASSHPTASRTGCSGRSRSCAAASRTTCASSCTTRISTIGSPTTTTRRATTGSRSRTGTGSSSSTRRSARTRRTS